MSEVKRNSYIAIARNDYKYVNCPENLETDGGYLLNNTLVIFQQVAEKYLKGFLKEYLEVGCEYDKLFTTHNLKKLGSVVNDLVGLHLNLKDLKYLSDCYFESRYPGDAYIEIVSSEEVKVCKDIVDTLIEVLEEKIAEFEEYKGSVQIKGGVCDECGAPLIEGSTCSNANCGKNLEDALWLQESESRLVKGADTQGSSVSSAIIGESNSASSIATKILANLGK